MEEHAEDIQFDGTSEINDNMWTRYFNSTLETDFGRVDDQKYFILTGKVSKSIAKSRRTNKQLNMNNDLLIQDSMEKVSSKNRDFHGSSHSSEQEISRNDSETQTKSKGNFMT